MASQAQLTRQARLLARIKFGGEVGALVQMLADAQSQRQLKTRNARTGAGALVATLEGLRPKIGSAYDTAAAAQQQGSAEADAGMAGLSGPVVDAIRASRAREAAGETARTAQARAGALTDVGHEQANARSGAIAETRAAEGQYRQDAQKIFSSLTGIQQRQGDFIESTTMDLTQKQQDRAIRESNLDISRQRLEESATQNRFNRRAGRRDDQLAQDRLALDRQKERRQAAQDKAGGGPGRKPLTRKQQNDYIDQIDTATAWAKQLKEAGKGSRDVRKAITNGVDTKITKPDGSTVKIKIPAFVPAVVNPAMQLVFGKRPGHLDPENKKRIKQRGVKVPPRWRARPATR